MKRNLKGLLVLALLLGILCMAAPAFADGTQEGLNYDSDGVWRLYRNGEFASGYTGLYYDPVCGWWLISNGTVCFDYTGLWNDPVCGWWLIGNGAICFEYNGIWDDSNVGPWVISGGQPVAPAAPVNADGLHNDGNAWHLYLNGEVAAWYNGLYGDPDLGWWLIGNGAINFDYTGLYCDANLGWWLISGGTICRDYTGLWYDPNVGWWFVENGAVNYDYTGLYCDANVGWWLISGGTICWDYTGLWNDPNYGWWLIGGGTVAFNYNGIWIDPSFGNWLISGGTIARNYTGIWEDPAFGTQYITDGCVREYDSSQANNPEVTVNYVFSSGTAEIGQPVTVWYEIKGGSGQYEEIHYMVDEVTEHCCINVICNEEELSAAQGCFTVVPESGEYFDVNVTCKDKVTGIVWSENYSEHIACTLSQTVPAAIHVASGPIALYTPFSFDYSIGGAGEIDQAKAEVWVFARNDTYPDCVLEQEITGKQGTITYVPKAGDQLYIAVRGKDQAGRPFYVKTDRLAIDTRNGYDPVTVEYVFSSGTAEIGQPVTVWYEIKGGSGQYEEIHYMVDEVTEHCCINVICNEEELSAAQGCFTVVPESGEYFDVNVTCKDKVTEIVWCENYSEQIACTPSQAIPVAISLTSGTVSQNVPFSFDYSIGGTGEIGHARAEVWVFARNDTYPDCVLEEEITGKNGTIVYIPKAGNQLYIAVRGKDQANRPFYAKTNRIEIK